MRLMIITLAVALASLPPSTAGADDENYVWPDSSWVEADPNDVDMDSALLDQARNFALSGGGSGYVTRHGKRIASWGDPRQLYDLKSTTKSIGITALGLALSDGKIRLSDLARLHHPTLGTPPRANDANGWAEEITILQLATQTAGFAKRGGYEKLLFRPGTQWLYSDGGPNWLAECVTRAYGQDIQELMFDRVFTPVGITRRDLRWRSHQYRPKQLGGVMRREFGSGVHANVDAMARLGYLYLRDGRWQQQQLIPAPFVRMARAPANGVAGLPEYAKDPRDLQPGTSSSYGNASDHYGLLWWNNADGTLENVPTDAYWSWGLYDSLILVIPSLDIVASRAGKSWERDPKAEHYEVLRPFFEPIVRSVRKRNDGTEGKETKRTETGCNPTACELSTGHAPYPGSKLIRRVRWAPPSTVRRQAEGSDNWPLTWGNDGHLYTAYGDGWGFEPRVPHKLSMGFARISGDAGNFRGSNIRSATGETLGQGAEGKKASGILMVDGVLYVWVRNANNSQLAWSQDHGKTWTWSDWKFTTSFGCPTFLNFGPNYADARDEFVYIYSFDSDSAYQPADRMVLARVEKQWIRARDAYRFLASTDDAGAPQWTDDISKRSAVFEHAGRCYRSGISHNAGLGRYLWCQALPESNDKRGPRFQGGFGIYDAPEPWGPWTTAYFTNEWDAGPGESSSLPTKWMSADGKTVHLVFSGDDYFSVRQGTLLIAVDE